MNAAQNSVGLTLVRGGTVLAGAGLVVRPHADLWVRGSRRDALRHARWMVVYLTRLYAQGESPTLAL